MSRQFCNQSVELLAPAGTFAIFREIVDLGCDAVYFGGKNLNMRLHRKDYNFTHQELADAVNLAHEKGKKAYITVNNLYNNQELSPLKEMLLYLAEIQPDAILVQDFSVLELLDGLGVSLPVHASIMMNVHNLETVKLLKKLGVNRVVLSREAPLSYARFLAETTSMEIEYFVHGDMCVAHGSQCVYSGMLFGQSSNRGRCLKPCRWPFTVEMDGTSYTLGFPLAVKDMCLHGHIPQLIHNKVSSFKIEGRMRDFAYLKGLITTYADALDRYLADPVGFDPTQGEAFLYENRKRDFSTGYAFGTPGLSNINSRHEGTGALYSSGKLFSTATPEREITQDGLEKTRASLAQGKPKPGNAIRLSVKVNNIAQAKVLLPLDVDIYLSGDVFSPDTPFTKADIQTLIKHKGNCGIYLAMPHMSSDLQIEQYQQLLSDNSLGLSGLLVTSIGAAQAFSNQTLLGEYSLNIYNSKAANYYRRMGLGVLTASPELKTQELLSLLQHSGDQLEVIVHGSPTVMYLEHDLFANLPHQSAGTLYLVDESGARHPVYKDIHGRNHLLLYKNLCYLPVLDLLMAAGLCRLRIEGAHLPAETLAHIVQVYQAAIQQPESCQALYQQLVQQTTTYTLGALEF